MKGVFSIILFIFWGGFQAEKQVTWQVKAKKISEEDYIITFKGKIKKGYYLYDSKLKVDGPLVTTLSYDNPDEIISLSPFSGISPKTKVDPIWEGEISYFTKTAIFEQKIKVKSKTLKLKGNIKSQTCSESDGRCVLNNDIFEVEL